MLETTARQDSQRPAVACSGCGWHYAPRPFERPQGIYPMPKRAVGRDVACRYIVRFDGHTYREPTAIDDYEVLLVNRHNEVIARISSLDTFPKPVDTSDFDDIPF